MTSVNKLKETLNEILDEIRAEKVFKRILFDYGYYGNGLTVKRLKGCLYHYNYICGLGNNKFQEGENYKYRLKNEEINNIINQFKFSSNNSELNAGEMSV